MSLIEHPRVNNLIQDLAGRRAVHACIQPWLAQLTGRVLDVGGGTGRIASLLPTHARYWCLDPDCRRSPAIVSHAQRLPFQSATLSAALMIGMVHHLTDAQLAQTLDELQRVLIPGGTVILLEPVSAPRLLSRVLWAGDRGGWPRTSAALYDRVAARFAVRQWFEFTVLHAYLAMRVENRPVIRPLVRPRLQFA